MRGSSGELVEFCQNSLESFDQSLFHTTILFFKSKSKCWMDHSWQIDECSFLTSYFVALHTQIRRNWSLSIIECLGLFSSEFHQVSQELCVANLYSENDGLVNVSQILVNVINHPMECNQRLLFKFSF